MPWPSESGHVLVSVNIPTTSKSLSKIQALVVLSLLTITSNTGLVAALQNGNSLTETHGCACPGDRVSYKCSVACLEPGIGSTVWRGSALDVLCSQGGGEIVLRHRSFNETRICGDITGQGIQVHMGESGRYTSQLNITVDPRLDNETIECIYHNGTATTLIGTSSVEVTQGPYPPPNDITISRLIIMDDLYIQLIFKWSAVVTNCPTLSYNIVSNCGLCPNSTAITNITCTDLLIGHPCTLSVRTSVCNLLVGNTTTLAAVFDVPTSPTFTVVPLYSHVTRNLSSVNIKVDATESPNAHTLSLSASLVYTVAYLDSVSGKICGSTDIPVSACNSNTLCSKTFKIPSPACPNPADIIVRVYGSNMLGRGPSLNNTLGVKNVYVEVTFNANVTSATCKFLQWQPLKSGQRTCSISYGNKQPYIQSPVEASWSDTVVLNLATESLLPGEYHFIVTATYGTFSTLVEGTFIKQENTEAAIQSTVSVWVFGISLGTMGFVFLLTVAFFSIIIVVVLIKSKKSPRNDPTSVSEPPIDTERNVAYEMIQR